MILTKVMYSFFRLKVAPAFVFQKATNIRVHTKFWRCRQKQCADSSLAKVLITNLKQHEDCHS